jgi:hypothetical protein
MLKIIFYRTGKATAETLRRREIIDNASSGGVKFQREAEIMAIHMPGVFIYEKSIGECDATRCASPAFPFSTAGPAQSGFPESSS